MKRSKHDFASEVLKFGDVSSKTARQTQCVHVVDGERKPAIKLFALCWACLCVGS